MRLPWNKKEYNKQPNPLPTHPIETLEEWVLQLTEIINVPQENLSVAPVLGGVLIYIRGEGIVWVPEEIFKELGLPESIGTFILKKAAPVAVGFAIGHVPGALISFVSSSMAEKLASYAILPPPKYPVAYLKSMIQRIEVIPAEIYAPLLKKIKKPAIKKHSKIESGEEGALRIVSKLDEKNTQKRKRITLYRYQKFDHVKSFLDAINQENIKTTLGEQKL